MKNFVQNGHSLDLLLAAVVVAGAMFKSGSILAVAAIDGAIGDTIASYVEGVYDLPKAVGAITLGATLYWDDTAKNLTTTSTSNTKAGYAAVAAASGDATVRIRLVPSI